MLVGKYDLHCPICDGEDFSIERKRQAIVDRNKREVRPTEHGPLPPGCEMSLIPILDTFKGKVLEFLFYTCLPCNKLIAETKPYSNVICVYKFNDSLMQTGGKKRVRYSLATGLESLGVKMNKSEKIAFQKMIMEEISEMMSLWQRDNHIVRYLASKHNIDRHTAQKYILLVKLQVSKARAKRSKMTVQQKYLNDFDRAIAFHEEMIRKWSNINTSEGAAIALQSANVLCKLQGLFSDHYSKVIAAANAGRPNFQIYLPASPRAREVIKQDLKVIDMISNDDGEVIPVQVDNANGKDHIEKVD